MIASTLLKTTTFWVKQACSTGDGTSVKKLVLEVLDVREGRLLGLFFCFGSFTRSGNPGFGCRFPS